MSTKRHRTSGVVVGVGLFLILSGVGGAAEAEHLSTQPNISPDIFVARIHVDYVQGSDRFTATGKARNFDLGAESSFHPIGSGAFELIADLDRETGALRSGTLSISGKISSLGIPDVQTLLSGTLNGFTSRGGGLFEFFFTAADGKLEPYYRGASGIVTLTSGLEGLSGDTSPSYSLLQMGSLAQTVYPSGMDAPGAGVADVHLSPEPTAAVAWSFLGPAILTAGICRWRRKSAT